ncbi:TPR repeat-containing protein [Robiginitalea myxolifaciens]|uniref:TPR repeat-containing protein n=1 Tax=Robiginitalea myxolifaciens TaxID=400055 RepID=A0A1I6GZJ4_9FLAO|nr:tetratricopeptide repeat protein [Robiginitalea myxolifaciens]SFR47461.1 TPR repeat-containing protein [Robiginitalea myxolifaciens]
MNTKHYIWVLCLFSLQLSAQKADTVRANFLYKSFKSAMRNNPEQAALFKDSLEQEAKLSGDASLIAQAYSAEGLAQYYKSDYYKAREALQNSIALYDSLGMEMELSRVLNTQGVVLKYLGEYEEATNTHLKSLEIKRALGMPVGDIVASLGNLGVIQMEMRNLDRSTQYYEEVLELSIEHGLERSEYIARGNLAGNYGDMGEYEKAESEYLKVIDYYNSKEDHRNEARGINSLGALYFQMDNIGKAKANYLRANEINKRHNLKMFEALTTRNLGKVAMKEENYDAALTYFQTAQALSVETGTLARNVGDYINIANALAALGRFEEAYEYRRVHFEKHDSIFNKERAEQISALEIRYESERNAADLALQKEEIKTLNAQKKAESLKKTIYAGGMFSFLAVAGGLFFGFRQRIKRNRIAREKQEEIYQNEIEHKKKELASQTLHLVQKNTFLEELQENLQALRQSPEKFKMEFRRIAMLLKKEKASDRDWETFKTYFSEVHNDFDQKLKTLADKITEKEIRLAAFLRMNLTTKEIAATMNVLPDSILKSKYRLKKKLGLEQETDLVEFLNSL